MWEGKDPLTFKSFPPVGTGPYKVKDASQTGITYERRNDWWGTKAFGVQPAPETVQFLYSGPETNVALALTSNDLDTPNIGILSLTSFLTVAQRNPNVKAWSSSSPYAWLDACPRALWSECASAVRQPAGALGAFKCDRPSVVDDAGIRGRYGPELGHLAVLRCEPDLFRRHL